MRIFKWIPSWMISKKPSVTISLYEVWWPLQQCTVWFGCIQTDLHTPYSACSSVSTISQNGFWNPLLHLKKTNVPITSMTPCVQSWPNALTPSLESNINKEHVDEDWWWTSSLKKVTTICTILLIAEVFYSYTPMTQALPMEHQHRTGWCRWVANVEP